MEESFEPKDWNVDEIIECFLPTDDKGKNVEKELMTLAPKAYSGNGVPLHRVWRKLTKNSQNAIKEYYNKEITTRAAL